jgi:dUTP pyrophosphatase
MDEYIKLLQKLQEIGPIESDEDELERLYQDFGLYLGDDAEYISEKSLKYKKLHLDAVVPKYNYPTDSGFDLHSTEEIVLPPFGRALVPSGLSFDIPEGFEVQVRTKSGLAIKKGLMVLNSPGTVDQGYTGEVMAIMFNASNETVTIEKGMKVAQAVLCPVVAGRNVSLEEITNLEDKDRGSNGFGSTGI